MGCMIPAEIVFITMPASTDFTGPIIGIVGVLIGSAIGFLGLRWQHKAQREYDIRKIAANLLAAGEELRDDYNDKKSSGLRTSDMDKVLGTADAKLNEMYRHHRHLELVAEPKVAVAAETYLEASAMYQTYTRSLYGTGQKPSDDTAVKTYERWNEAKEDLLVLLNKKRVKVDK